MTEDVASSPFKPLTLSELFAHELPEIEYLVEGLLPAASVCLLDGREKSGKSLLSLDLCASIALGEPFLDRAVTEGPAVYCAAEENMRDVRARLAERLGERRDAPLFILMLDGSTGDRLQLEDPVSKQRLLDMIVDIEPLVVVLDPFRELHSGREDVSDDMAPILRPVRQLAHQAGVTLVLNHHQNKSGTARGSTAILAACDLGWSFSRTDGDDDTGGAPRGVLKVEGRHGPRSFHKVRLGEGLHWELDEAEVRPPDPSARVRILTHLDTVNAWKTARELATETNMKLKTVQNLLAEMRKEPAPLFAVQRTGKKNDPSRFHTLAPRLEGVPDGQQMIPPEASSLGSMAGGNHLPGSVGKAGNDRWTQ